MTNPDSEEFHKGKSDHPNEWEVTQGNDPEKVATELNEDRMAYKGVSLVVSTSVSFVFRFHTAT